MNYYENICEELKEEGFYEEFLKRLLNLTNINGFEKQFAFDLLYSTYKLNGRRFFE